MFPASLTGSHLENFRNFRDSLNDEDRQVFDELLERVRIYYPLIDYLADELFPYQMLLLLLIMEHHKALERLKSDLEFRRWTAHS
jgi:hypothetical protein